MSPKTTAIPLWEFIETSIKVMPLILGVKRAHIFCRSWLRMLVILSSESSLHFLERSACSYKLSITHVKCQFFRGQLFVIKFVMQNMTSPCKYFYSHWGRLTANTSSSKCPKFKNEWLQLPWNVLEIPRGLLYDYLTSWFSKFSKLKSPFVALLSIVCRSK